MHDPIPFAWGRDADVFVLDARRVLRRYRRGGDVAAEAAVMIHLASYGFPVPVVYEAAGPDLVLQRIDGPTMVCALADGSVGIDAAADILAELHSRLHAVPPRISKDPQVRILHLDLHPANVLLGADGPVLIDWRNAREGPPDLDVAMTAVILGQAALDDAGPMAAAAGRLLHRFLLRVPGDPLSRMDEAIHRRRADPALSQLEVARLDAVAQFLRESLG